MDRIKTVVAMKEIYMERITSVWYYGDGEYNFYKCPYPEFYPVHSIEDINEAIKSSIAKIEETTEYKCSYVITTQMQEDNVSLIKRVIIVDQNNNELCYLDVYEGAYKREVIFDYNMEAVVTYFTKEEKQKINDLCRNGDMEYELWYRIDRYGDDFLRKVPNIKLMPTSRAGFDFINAIESSSNNRGFEEEDDLAFWRVDQYHWNAGGRLFKCNNGCSLGTYQ